MLIHITFVILAAMYPQYSSSSLLGDRLKAYSEALMKNHHTEMKNLATVPPEVKLRSVEFPLGPKLNLGKPFNGSNVAERMRAGTGLFANATKPFFRGLLGQFPSSPPFTYTWPLRKGAMVPSGISSPDKSVGHAFLNPAFQNPSFDKEVMKNEDVTPVTTGMSSPVQSLSSANQNPAPANEEMLLRNEAVAGKNLAPSQEIVQAESDANEDDNVDSTISDDLPSSGLAWSELLESKNTPTEPLAEPEPESINQGEKNSSEGQEQSGQPIQNDKASLITENIPSYHTKKHKLVPKIFGYKKSKGSQHSTTMCKCQGSKPRSQVHATSVPNKRHKSIILRKAFISDENSSNEEVSFEGYEDYGELLSSSEEEILRQRERKRKRHHPSNGDVYKKYNHHHNHQQRDHKSQKRCVARQL